MSATNSTKKKPRDWKARFLKNLREVPCVTRAAELAAVNRTTVYRMRKRDAKFREDWDAAEQDGYSRLEELAFERARGVTRQVKKIVEVRDAADKVIERRVEVCESVEASDTMVIFLLKAGMPGKYREGFDYGKLAEALQRARLDDRKPAG